MNLADLNKEITKMNPLASSAADSDFSKIDEWIGTGNYLLNAAMSGDIYKGIPNNRITCFAGPSGVGKTFILLNACREAQKQGYHIYYFDSENAVDQDTLRNFDIDLNNITVIPVATIQDFRHQITVIVNTIRDAKRAKKEYPKVFFALDSASQLASAKEVDDAQSGSDKADMTRPKLIRSVFRILTIPLAEIKAPLVFTNHTYESNSLFATVNISGGGGILYSASNIMLFDKAQLKNKAKEKVGIIINSKAHKNRFVKPDKKIKIHIHFTKGMNPFIGLHNYISWDTCGIERGKLEPIYEDVPELDDEGNEVIYKSGKNKGEVKMKQEPTGEYKFEPKDTERYNFAVKHLGQEVSSKEFFTSKVFTPEVLEILREKVKDDFVFKKERVEEEVDLNDMADDEDEN